MAFPRAFLKSSLVAFVTCFVAFLESWVGLDLGPRAFLIQAFLAFTVASFAIGIGLTCTFGTGKDHSPFKVASCIIKVVVFLLIANTKVDPFVKATSSFAEALNFTTFVNSFGFESTMASSLPCFEP